MVSLDESSTYFEEECFEKEGKKATPTKFDEMDENKQEGGKLGAKMSIIPPLKKLDTKCKGNQDVHETTKESSGKINEP
jgi:hypothetical protein